MADCTAQGLSVSSTKLSGSLTFKQLLAALVYIQCTSNGMNCTPQSLSSASACLYDCMTEKQLLAALLYVQCTSGGGGGGGGGAVQILQYTGASPTADGLLPTNQNLPAEAYKDDGTLPTYTWNTTSHTWNP